ncbi:BTAD domain-containing putative transcriptional regulator [Nocardia salmonicida]|uniref:AfsR/SARP family transcriptional regulator n=1 Tax=Nocardia salmonicida TaxID=53431 RepID=UPI003CF0FE2F
MEIRILGPFEVTLENRDITPSAPKLRAVLMLLALNVGRVVRIDQLMSELWDDRPPQSASTTLQTYIYQLRKLLRLVETVTLETTQFGYVLRLKRGSLDAAVFEDLVGEGMNLLDGGDLVNGVTALDAALGMWRGRLAESEAMGPILQAEIVRLEELRKTALEQRISAQLRLGRHHQLVGELSGLASENPTHEGIRSKLMLALYRSGRRLNALDSYHDIRTLLVRELGLEPSVELQKLYHLIVSEDPVLDYSGADREGSPGPGFVGRPSQLPPNVFLVDRERQLQAVARILEPRTVISPVVAISGAPGSGKTALAVHAAHQARPDYPDGQLWAELCTPNGDPIDPSTILRDFLRAIGFSDSRIPAGLEHRTLMFRSWTAANRALVVLDDIVDINQLIPLLPTGPGCATIITSRRKLAGPATMGSVPVKLLGRGAARQLLVNLLGEARIEQESESVTSIIESCEGLPAALSAVSNVLVRRPHWPVARLRDWRSNQDCGPGLRPASACDEVVEIVRKSYRLLSAPVQFAFRTLAIEKQFTAAEAASRLGKSDSEAESLLEELVEFQLLDVVRTKTSEEFQYCFMPLFRDVAKVFAREVGEHVVAESPDCYTSQAIGSTA